MAEVRVNNDESVRSDGAALHSADQQQSRVLSSGDSSVMGSVVHKVCCVCGTELHRRPRFKDSQGRYWCPHCNELDQMRKLPADCPDCKKKLTRADMHDFRGTLVCQFCFQKRVSGSKREDARLRASEADAKELAGKQRWWVMVCGAIVVGLLICGVAAVALFWK